MYLQILDDCYFCINPYFFSIFIASYKLNLIYIPIFWNFDTRNERRSVTKVTFFVTFFVTARLCNTGASIWFENWGVSGPGLKTGVSWVQKFNKQRHKVLTGLRI